MRRRGKKRTNQLTLSIHGVCPCVRGALVRTYVPWLLAAATSSSSRMDPSPPMTHPTHHPSVRGHSAVQNGHARRPVRPVRSPLAGRRRANSRARANAARPGAPTPRPAGLALSAGDHRHPRHGVTSPVVRTCKHEII